MTVAFSLAPQLTCDDLLHLKPSLQAYLECFHFLFPRCDQGASLVAYAEGQLPEERRKPIKRMVLRWLAGEMN